MKNKIAYVVLLLLIAGSTQFIGGCTAFKNAFIGPEATRMSLAEVKQKWPSATDRQARQMNNGSISVGMKKYMVIAAWGEPSRVNRTTSKYGGSEQWVYGSGYNTSYVYFRGGAVTTIQN